MQATQLPTHAGHMSYTLLGVLLVVGAIVCYTVFVLYGAKIDGDRQKVRDHGERPVTDEDGHVHARSDG